ncbi:MAG: methyltransferase domain-containing protein [Thermoleophilia bacterium]
MAHQFDPKDFRKLENPKRLEFSPPEATVEKFPVGQGDRVADIGCGAGYYLLPLARRVGDAGVVYGIDLHEELLDRCASKAHEEGLSNVVLVKAEPDQVPVADGEVDFVLMSNVLHELSDPGPLLAEVRRIGRDGAKLLVLEWKPAEMPIGPPVAERLAPQEVARILEREGFSTGEVLDLNKGQYGVVAGW